MELMTFTNEQTMSSREIAALTNKEHKNVLRDIDILNEHYESMGLLIIEQGYYTHPNTGNQKHREYLLTKIQTLDLMTGYRPELRIKVNRRWEELEKREAQNMPAIPQTFSEALRLAADLQEKNEQQAKQLEEQKPKVLFTEAVMSSKKSVLVGELAKILKQNGVDMGQNRLFEWLRSNGFLMSSKGERYNQPTQKSMDMKLFELKKTTIHQPDNTVIVKTTTKVTPEGQVYFVNKFLNNKES